MVRRGGRGGRGRRWNSKKSGRSNNDNNNSYNDRNRGYGSGGRGGKKHVEISRYVLEYQTNEKTMQNNNDINNSDSDSNSTNMSSDKKHNNSIQDEVKITNMNPPVMSEEELNMMQLMGFAGFGTTKGTLVKDNQYGPAKGGARIEKGPRKYRQYMNRLGKNKLLDSDSGSSVNKII